MNDITEQHVWITFSVKFGKMAEEANKILKTTPGEETFSNI
jgi:hypothetical protein